MVMWTTQAENKDVILKRDFKIVTISHTTENWGGAECLDTNAADTLRGGGGPGSVGSSGKAGAGVMGCLGAGGGVPGFPLPGADAAPGAPPPASPKAAIP